MDHLIYKQCSKIKSSIVNINNQTNNQLNEIFSSFNSLHKEFSLGFCLVNNLPDQFSFHIVNYKDMKASLLFLLPPSYIVVPIGNIVNKSTFSPTIFNTTITALNVKSSIPTMSSAYNIGIDIPTRQVPASELKMRGRSPASSVNLSRESLMASSRRLTPYHDRMDTDIDFKPTTEELNLELSYETEQEKALWVSIAANY